MAALRYAVMVGDGGLEQWHLRCVERLAPYAEPAGVVHVPGPRPPGVARPVLRRLVHRVEEPVDSAVLGEPAPVGFEALDFVLRLGAGALPRPLPAARFGVWCFRHELPGAEGALLREVCRRSDVTETALIALVEPGGDEAVLAEGCFRTDTRSYRRNRDQVLDVAASWPARFCRLLVEGVVEGLPPTSRSPASSESRAPLSLAAYALAITASRVTVAFRRIFRHPQWGIGILPRPIETMLEPPDGQDDEVEWLDGPGRSGFLADAFGLERSGRVEILCERFDYGTGKGEICTIPYPQEVKTDPSVTGLSLPTHMSYPFLFEDAGDVYCVPETSGAGEIALYRADRFPRRWSRVGPLIEGFPGIDPTIFRHDERWWLMATRQGPLQDVELWAWHAPALGGPWTEHARNPVKTDVRGARPAGRPFVVGGALYRPAQDCSKRYGWRVAIQRVGRLTPSEYEEEPAAFYAPSRGSRYPRGRHTLCDLGGTVLVDGHRDIFSWRAALGFVSVLLGRSNAA